MSTLIATPQGSFIITAINGRPVLVRHLAEIGFRVGQRLTVIQTARAGAGMLVYFQGQPLAVSDEIASQIAVAPLTDFEDAQLVALATLAVGDAALVGRIDGQGAQRLRLLEMGLTRGTLVKLVKKAPLGDPLELAVRGYKLTLRKQDAQAVQVERMTADA